MYHLLTLNDKERDAIVDALDVAIECYLDKIENEYDVYIDEEIENIEKIKKICGSLLERLTRPIKY